MMQQLTPRAPQDSAPYSRSVNFVRRLRDRWHALIKELTKFGIIGIVNTALDFAVWNALLFIGPIKAQVISTTVSATSSYFMNRHWTFRHRARSGLRREYLLFFGFNAIGLLITAAILGIATYAFHVEHVAALNVVKLFAIGIATAFRFWAYRRWVFLHPEDQLYEPEDEPAPQR
ncbi:Putative flippase GtrA (transmembrane translocase of bactoprenol-linked glucose) [Cryptosporangium aurantiacum]|uniref:Putative flippase GtrA (Transmembrane translocase of bactoprenol-linked glucose) n=1 Tax=Cryptosporangium aurantiacum TaxID=134849 RepID=A0A1M7QV31_9ACTN|nr:Putative flippase GtrA (transmembrane translocase of bactoprenol-linked glucose) [Cryptosporangium aurantiacum]